MSAHEHKHTTVSVHAVFKWLWNNTITLSFIQNQIFRNQVFPNILKTILPRYSFLYKSVCLYFDAWRSNIQ